MKQRIKIAVIFFLIILATFVVSKLVYDWYLNREHRVALAQQEEEINDLLNNRRAMIENAGEDLFGNREVINVLLIGMDSRVGQTDGHCDAIQIFTIDRKNKRINITAVPRGTYVPLPGSGYKATDYYVSNSCGLVSLEYGISQIEKISGLSADYLVIVGFSSTKGILREMDLPATETLQWLRNRQAYAIGEPQRARNHSTFLKQMLMKYSTGNPESLNKVWEYLIYKMVKTDLSFEQVSSLAATVAKMDLANNSENIHLYMRPAHAVTDIVFDPENLDEKVQSLIEPLINRLPADDYSGETNEEIQERLIQQINAGLSDSDFIKWAYDNYIWLQVDDYEKREQIHYDIVFRYVKTIKDVEEKKNFWLDYINEMQLRDEQDWAEKGKSALDDLIK